MNERILELYLHAFPPSLNDSNMVQMSAEKFAELIVKECAEVSNQAEKQCQHPGTMIKQHFGVEE